MESLSLFQIVNLILNFGVVPVIVGIWKLAQNQNEIKLSIMQIRVDLYRDFVTKAELKPAEKRRMTNG